MKIGKNNFSLRLLELLLVFMLVPLSISHLVNQKLWDKQWFSVLNCKEMKCSRQQESLNSENLRTLKLTLHIQKLQSFSSWNSLGKYSVFVTKNSLNKIVIHIPRTQKWIKSATPIELPYISSPAKITLTIIDGLYYEITVNNDIVFAQRYNNETFTGGKIDLDKNNSDIDFNLDLNLSRHSEFDRITGYSSMNLLWILLFAFYLTLRISREYYKI